MLKGQLEENKFKLREEEMKTIESKIKLNDEILHRKELQLRLNEIYTEMSEGGNIRARLDEVNE